jgi:hypothetical protein
VCLFSAFAAAGGHNQGEAMLKQITLAAIIALGLSAETIGNVNSAFKKGEKKPRLGILNNSILLLWLITTADPMNRLTATNSIRLPTIWRRCSNNSMIYGV